MSASNASVTFVPHSGQDPEQLQMLANTYGWRIVWPKNYAAPHHAQWGTSAQAIGSVVLCVGVIFALVSRFRGVLVALGLFCLCAVAGHADTLLWTTGTASYSENGISKTCYADVMYSYGTNYYLSVHITSSGSPTDHWVYNIIKVNGSIVHNSSQNSIALNVGSGLGDVVTVEGGGSPSGGTQYFTCTIAGSPPVTSYDVAFNIPANDTNHDVTYIIRDAAGTIIKSLTNSPGSSATTMTATGLTSNADVTLSTVTGGEVMVNDAGTVLSVSSDSSIAVVNHATPTGHSDSGPPPTTTGTTPPPITVNPNAPASAPTVSAPSSVTVGGTLGTSANTTTTDAATNGAVNNVANQVGAAANAINSQSATNTDKQTSVATTNTNAVISAINTQTTAIDTDLGKLVTAVKSISVDNTAVKTSIDAGNAIASDQAATTQAIPTIQNPSGLSPAFAPGSFDGSTLASKLPTAPTFSGLTPASSIHIAFDIPKLTGGSITVDKTVDFSAAPYHTPITIFRGLLLVLLTLVFFITTFYTVRGAFTGK